MSKNNHWISDKHRDPYHSSISVPILRVNTLLSFRHHLETCFHEGKFLLKLPHVKIYNLNI